MGGKRWGTSVLSIFYRPSFCRPFRQVPEDLLHQISGQDRSQPCYRHNHPPTSDPAKKMGGKRWGLLFSALLTRALAGMPTDSGLRRFLSSSLSICRTLNLREKSFLVLRSSETATAGSVAASGLVSLPSRRQAGAECVKSSASYPRPVSF